MILIFIYPKGNLIRLELFYISNGVVVKHFKPLPVYN